MPPGMAELSTSELTTALLAWSRDELYPDEGEHPVWRWERWIIDDPERAWIVFEQLVRQAPEDIEVLERVAQRLELLLSRHWAEFRDRALRLARSTQLLDRRVGPEVFAAGRYGPRYRTVDELASVWLRHDAHAHASHRITDIMRSDASLATTLALEIIGRGPLHGFQSWDLNSPLLELVHFHGSDVIARVEAAAAGDEGLRRLIWEARRINRNAHSIPSDLWSRLMQAAGATTLYNSSPPPGRRLSLGPEYDELLDHWFVSQESFWAWVEVDRLVREAPEDGWDAIGALLRQATTEKALVNIGCGPLEDLLRKHPSDFVERSEELAKADDGFRFSLACVWLSLEDVPEPLARRYWVASGQELAVLDAPPGWRSSSPCG